MGERGRNYVEDNYSWNKILESMRRIIDNVGFCKKELSDKKEELLDVSIINSKVCLRFKK